MLRTRLPTQETWEMWVQSLGREDRQEEDMATHSSILARRITRTEGPGGLQSKVAKSWTQLKRLCLHVITKIVQRAALILFLHLERRVGPDHLGACGSFLGTSAHIWAWCYTQALNTAVTWVLSTLCLSPDPWVKGSLINFL